MSTTGNSSQGTTGGRRSIPEFAAALIGSTLDGRFRIDTAIGQGAMGTVFAATQLSVNRRVAVKVLREQISETSKKRFMREARAISSMNHPNIVQLVDFGEREDGLLYLVMEYVEGLRMSRLNKKGRLHPNLIIELVSQICSALAEAHSHGIVHRDLKPSNILLVITADGSVQVKVLDFGVAHTYEDAAELTATGVLCGTPAYMAPEQARGKNVTPSVDLYALGVNMYQMLGGFRPFRGATPVEVAMKQIQAVAPSLRQYVDQNLLPNELVKLAEQLMAKEPRLRPQTASEVRQKVLQIRREFGWGPLVFETSASDVWSRWTQQRLAEHGGRPLREEVKQSKSWAGSWAGSQSQGGATGARPLGPGSQAALHDASGVRPPVPGDDGADADDEVPPTQDSHGGASRGSRASVSEDSLPSRHGGGWDAFRGNDDFPTGAGSFDPHVLEPSPSHPARPDEIASPSEETAHIYDVANQVSPVRHPQESGIDAAGEYRVPSQPSQPSPPSPPSPSSQPSQPSQPSQAEERIQTMDTSASYQELWREGANEPRDSQASRYENLSTLVADKPPRQGTLVDDYEEDTGPSTTDIVRFVLVAVLAFGVFVVVGWFVFNDRLDGADAAKPELVHNRSVEEGAAATEDDPVEDPPEENEASPTRAAPRERPAAKKPPKRPPAGSTASKAEEETPKKDEPIDLFGDEAADDDPDKKIIIEEKR